MCIYQLDFHAVGRPLSLTPITNELLTLSIYTLIRLLTLPVQYAYSVGSIPTYRTPPPKHPMSYAQLSHNAREIVARYQLATTQEINLGCDWYPSARKIAGRIAFKYSVPVATVVGVISALSPRNEWSRNIIDAEAMCKLHQSHATRKDLQRLKVCTFKPNKLLAISMLTLPSIPPEAILTGDKRLEFYNCIYRPHLDDVCIDGHAYSVWLGSRVPTTKTPNLGVKLRRQIKQDYRDACAFINEELGESYTAADLQAITWVTHKRIHGV